ncbi:methyltransferase GliN [Byssothecium circinans]|uniref:Methyltransferase GliN n=1 Tax=Byssothecium circinans TaxID=147558 RepID=A0A6A5U7G9_9PLEO|nr:methyltransferase GliN [Byssothecium circinans]
MSDSSSTHLLHKNVMNNKLIRVPLPTQHPVDILDAGTGDGLWMLDALDEFPIATLLGTDINETHFKQIADKLPSPISFKKQDLTASWPEEDKNRYDLVHMRYCFLNFVLEKDAKVVESLFELVKPGGYIVLIEADMLSFEDGENHPGMTEFMKYAARAFPEVKMNPSAGSELKRLIKDAGAQDVKEVVFSFGMGVAADTEGMLKETTENMASIIANFALFGSKMPNYWYSQEDFEMLNNSVAHELNTIGNTWKFWMVTGKKCE